MKQGQEEVGLAYNTVRNQEIDTHKLLEVVVIRPPEAQVLLVVQGLMVVLPIEEGIGKKGGNTRGSSRFWTSIGTPLSWSPRRVEGWLWRAQKGINGGGAVVECGIQAPLVPRARCGFPWPH